MEDANFTYQYDNKGNQTRKTAKVGGAITQYEYDAENKLVRVVSPTNTANYRYDGLGRGVEKEVIAGSTTTTRYVYDNEDILLELNGTNAIVARYTHGPGTDEPLIMEKNSGSFYYQSDGLGSITELTNQSGTVAQRYTYSSFGKIESQLDPNFVQPYTFTSREFDPETGLYFYRMRYYDPMTGRFIEEDALGSDPAWIAGEEGNLYVYVTNMPTSYADPLGWFKLPNNPSGLPPGWYPSPSDPRGRTYIHPDEPGRELRYDPGDPKDPNQYNQKDHWHDTRPGEKTREGRWHRNPGEEVPDPGADLRGKPGRRPPGTPRPTPVPTPIVPPPSYYCPLPLFIPNLPLFQRFLNPGAPSA